MSRWMTNGWAVQAPKLAGEGPTEATVTYHEYYHSAAFNCAIVEDGAIVICFGSSNGWEKDHPWLAFRRDQIIGRVTESVLEPGWVADFSEVKGFTYAHIRKQAATV